MLDENGFKVGYRFSEKIKSLQLAPQYSPTIEGRPWLKERLEGLYTSLDALRGTIIRESSSRFRTGRSISRPTVRQPP